MSRSSWVRRLELAPAAALAVALTGCGPKITKFHMRDALTELRSDYGGPVAPGGAGAKGEIAVTVVSAPSVGCWGPGACVDLEATSVSRAADELQAELGRRKIKEGFVYFDLGPTAAEILRERLGQRFQKVTVTLAKSAAPGSIAVKPGPVPWTQNVGRMVLFTLVATGEGPIPKVGTGTSVHVMSHGHYAWAVPLTLVMFPHGVFWVPPIVWGIRDKHTGIATAEAMDRAAESLTTQLAGKAEGPEKAASR